MTRSERKNKLSKLLWSYGYLSFVVMIDKLEKEERYEDCQLIKEVLEDSGEFIDHPTNFNEEAIEYYTSQLKRFGWTKENTCSIMARVPFYIDEIENEVFNK